MKYKIDPIQGMPEWFTTGIVCRVRDLENHTWNEHRMLCGFIPYDKGGSFVDSDGNAWRFAEPVEQWEPQEGEWVAGWNVGWNDFCVCVYLKNVRTFDHYARLVYPDGRIIDCACDVETLKTRTDWV